MQRPEEKNGTPSPASPTLVGVITSAHGIRGQVKLRSFMQDPESLFAHSPITDKSGRRHFTFKREGCKDQLFIASIKGVTNRNEAELLKGTELYATIAPASSLKENQWLYSDLKGLDARLRNGSRYGMVVEVYNFGAGDIIEIKKNDGTLEMLPFKKTFVGDIHLEQGFLEVFPPDYVEPADADKDTPS